MDVLDLLLLYKMKQGIIMVKNGVIKEYKMDKIKKAFDIVESREDFPMSASLSEIDEDALLQFEHNWD